MFIARNTARASTSLLCRASIVIPKYVNSTGCYSLLIKSHSNNWTPPLWPPKHKQRILLSTKELHVANIDSDLEISKSQTGPEVEYIVVNFYHLTDIEDPEEVVAKHKRWMGERDIRGRIYISEQGINAQYSGISKDAMEYMEWIKQQRHFSGLKWNIDRCSGHLFPKLRLKYKANLIQLSGGMQSYPITKPEARANPLNPNQWEEMLQRAINTKANREENVPVVLDLRNNYEWDLGHFKGSERPSEESFCETPSKESPEIPKSLKYTNLDTPIMMYCTGGIRCDVYSTVLKEKGYKNLYSLEGGVQRYFKEKGSALWDGSLFVFDARMAIPPTGVDEKMETAIECQICGDCRGEAPHFNCANVDCNRLVLGCKNCKEKFSGCCCEECISAPRLLRPIATDGETYKNWGTYAMNRLKKSGIPVNPEIHNAQLEKNRNKREAKRNRLREKRRTLKEMALMKKQAKNLMELKSLKESDSTSSDLKNNLHLLLSNN